MTTMKMTSNNNDDNDDKEGENGILPLPPSNATREDWWGTTLRWGTVEGSGRVSDDGKVEDEDINSGGGGSALMINDQDGQAEGLMRIHDNGMVCANASASAPSSVMVASERVGDIRVQHK